MDGETTASRADMYGFLASLFLQEPDEQTLPKQLQALNLAEQYAPSSLTALVSSISQEYFDCFFVPMSSKYTPPLESVFTGASSQGRGPLVGPATQETAQLYETTGFNPADLLAFAPLKEMAMPDHVGFELAFMTYLCLQEEKSAERCDRAAVKRWTEWQFHFLSEHLTCWLPKLAEALEKRQTRFYAAAASLSADWAAADLGELMTCSEGEV